MGVVRQIWRKGTGTRDGCARKFHPVRPCTTGTVIPCLIVERNIKNPISVAVAREYNCVIDSILYDMIQGTFLLSINQGDVPLCWYIHPKHPAVSWSHWNVPNWMATSARAITIRSDDWTQSVGQLSARSRSVSRNKKAAHETNSLACFPSTLVNDISERLRFCHHRRQFWKCILYSSTDLM